MARLSTSICLNDHTKTPALLVSTEDRTRLHDLFRTFRRLGRLLVPSEEVYEDAGRGDLDRRSFLECGSGSHGLCQLLHDCVRDSSSRCRPRFIVS